MLRRKLLVGVSLFNALVNTVYLIRFFGILSPEPVVYGYVPWFMSFMLSNIFVVLLFWVLVYSLLKKADTLAAVFGFVVSGALIFHALNGFMFALYTGSLAGMSLFNAIYEVAVYGYGLVLAAFYIVQFWKTVKK